MENDDKTRQLAAIGLRVRDRRLELDLTQDQLRQRAGVSKSFLSEVEGGKRAASGLNYLQLAEALDVDIAWLLKGVETPSSEVVPPERPPPVHPLLANIAESRGWTYARTAEAASMLNAVCARRTRGGAKWEPTVEYVERLAKLIDDEAGW